MRNVTITYPMCNETGRKMNSVRLTMLPELAEAVVSGNIPSDVADALRLLARIQGYNDIDLDSYTTTVEDPD